jgi:hypothetical protein
VANSWLELLSVVHLMTMLTLSKANSLMILKDHFGFGMRIVSSGLYLYIWPSCLFFNSLWSQISLDDLCVD